MIKKHRLLALFIFLFSFGHAQELTQEEIKTYTQECNALINYLEFTLNSVGENDLSPKEKDIIISESFNKLFRDGKVQVEDDLVPKREAITNKDVQAYLKDVDFFFQRVNFSYKILSTNLLKNENNKSFFKVHALRTLAGKTISGDSLHNEQPRFIEVAVNSDLRELKIVSIYTTKINENEENIKWWNDLTWSWKTLLGENVMLCDNIEFARVLYIHPDKIVVAPAEDTADVVESILIKCDNMQLTFGNNKIDTIYLKSAQDKENYQKQIIAALNKILQRKDLDISNRLDILHLDAVSKLSALNSLNISGTLIRDIYPIRNLIDLQELNISRSQVNSLDALIYSMSLRNLDISGSKVFSLEPLANISQIAILNISNTPIDNISALSEMTKLSDLRMENTMVNDLSPLKGLVALNYLSIDKSPVSSLKDIAQLPELKIITFSNTMVRDLEPLSTLQNLAVIYCDNTEITSLKALDNKPSLTKIYCDNTLLGKEKAVDFMLRNPKVLVVYESQKLQMWFDGLPVVWKNIFKSYVPLNDKNPTKEQLHQVAGILELDLKGKKDIKNIDPLAQIQPLKKLNVSGTGITHIDALFELRDLNSLDLSQNPISKIQALENHNTLQFLDISGTSVNTLEALKQSTGLKKLVVENTPLTDISPLFSLASLRELRLDGSKIPNSQIEEFIVKNGNCSVIYRSEELNQWWNSLSAVWKLFFNQMNGWTSSPTVEQLHELTQATSLSIENNRSINSISELGVFTYLKTLKIYGTLVSDISVLSKFKYLEDLDLSQNPLEKLESLKSMTTLRSIKIANTQVSDLDWITTITRLQFLDISGTPVKNLKPLSTLFMLETLIAYNTKISQLKPLNGLISLKNLKIYNTGVSQSKVDQFKSANPSCAVDYY